MNRIIKKSYFYRFILSLPLLLFAAHVCAEKVSFDYIQAAFITGTVNYDESISNVEGTGIGFALSLGFSPILAMTLDVQETTFDRFHDTTVKSAKVTSLGVTAHKLMDSGPDLFANLSILKADIVAKPGTVSSGISEFGYSMKFGMRKFVSDKFELELTAKHEFVLDDIDNSLHINGRYYVYKRVSAGLGFVTGDVVEALLFNLRLDV